jgi:hypothetical protein
MSNFWMGIAASQNAMGKNKRADRGLGVLSILAGVLLAVLIGAALLALAAFSN